MIRNWEEHGLNMCFKQIPVPQGAPSDIDMWYLAPRNFLIIGEIKNGKGTYTNGQKALHAKLVDSHKGGGIVLYITHGKDVHHGDSVVDVSQCQVSEYYFKGKWRKPKQYTTVSDAFMKLLGG